MTKKILLVLIMFFTFGLVHAEELKELELIWENNQVGEVSYVEKYNNSYYVYGETGIYNFYNQVSNYVKKYAIEDQYYNYKIENDKIYLFISKENGGIIFKLIDRDFKELKSVELDLHRIAYYEKRNDGYIFFGNKGQSDTTLVYFKLDKDFKVLETKETTTTQWAYINKKANDNSVYYFQTNYPNHYYKFDGEFSEITYEELQAAPGSTTHFSLYFNTTNSNMEINPGISEELYNRILAKETVAHSNTEMYAQIIKDGTNYVVLYQEQSFTHTEGEKVINYGFKLVYLDKDLNKKWEKVFADYLTDHEMCDIYHGVSTMISVSHGNIILLSNYNNKQTFNTYNRNGELTNQFEKKITNSAEYAPSYVDLTDENLFIVYTTYNTGGCSAKNDAAPSIKATLLANTLELPQMGGSIVYYFSATYKVNTKVTGKGNVSISAPSASEGEEVIFTIEPEEGYVLGAVKVYDAEGNEIKLTGENSFIMPASDVTIEAEFIKQENPKTADFAILSFMAVAIIAGITIITLSHKYKKLILK